MDDHQFESTMLVGMSDRFVKEIKCSDLVVDTRFCTHDLIKEDDWNDQPCIPKIMTALHTLICSSHIIKMILRF